MVLSPLAPCCSDVVVVDNCQTDAVPEREKFGRMKLLQFSENHRPAYWGTWNKRTSLIRARNPWAKDTVSTSACWLLSLFGLWT